MNEEQGHQLMQQIEQYLADKYANTDQNTAPDVENIVADSQKQAQIKRQLYTQLALAGIGIAGILWQLKKGKSQG